MIWDMVIGTIAEINCAGTSILIVEQNMRRSLGISDRGYVLEMGRHYQNQTGNLTAETADDAKKALRLPSAANGFTNAFCGYFSCQKRRIIIRGSISTPE